MLRMYIAVAASVIAVAASVVRVSFLPVFLPLSIFYSLLRDTCLLRDFVFRALLRAAYTSVTRTISAAAVAAAAAANPACNPVQLRLPGTTRKQNPSTPRDYLHPQLHLHHATTPDADSLALCPLSFL